MLDTAGSSRSVWRAGVGSAQAAPATSLGSDSEALDLGAGASCKANRLGWPYNWSVVQESSGETKTSVHCVHRTST